MRSLTEISLADAVKVLYYLKPERGSNDKIQLIISLLGFSIISDQKQVPKLIDNESFLGSSQKEVDIVEPTKSEVNPSEAEQPIKNIEKLEVDVLKEPQGQVIPEVIRTAESLPSEVYSMETIVFRNTQPSVQLLSPNNARAYIHDTFSSDVFSDEINIDIVIEQISRGTAPKVEFVKKKSFHGPVHVLIDRNRSMEPFEEDADSLYRYIQKLAGIHACEGYWCFDTPDDELFRLSDKKRIENYPEVPLPQTILILISDLGAARPFAWSPVSPRRWSASLRRLAQLFYRIIVVSPYPKKRLPELRHPNIGIVPWGMSRYATYSGSRQTLLDNFAVMMAPAAFMNKDLVRNARTTFYPGMYPGLEADLMFSWMMVVSNPLVISFRQETLKVLRQILLDDSALRAKAVAFLARYRGKCQQYNLPGWLRFEEELMHNALEGNRTQVDDAVRRLIRTLTGHDDNVQLARWALSVANELPGKSSTAEDRQNLQIAAQLRLGIVPKKFKESGRRISWLLPKEKKVGIRQEDVKVRFLDNPEAGDNQISVPATVPRYLYIEGQDGTKERVTLWNDQNDVTVSVRLLPITISTLSGAQYRIGGPPKRRRIIRILIIAPSDVAEERKIAESVVHEWNKRHKREGIMLEPVRWELDAAPDFGNRVQGVIHRQIFDTCGLAIGIFWNRIGTHTGFDPGGAVEEVELMIESKKPVMLYFSRVPIDPDTIDYEQRAKLDQFIKGISPQALFHSFSDRKDFQHDLSRHLDLQIPRWFGDSDSQPSEPPKPDHAANLRLYQSTLKEELRWIRMLGLPNIERINVNLDDDTFVPLRFTCNRELESDVSERLHSMLEMDNILTPDRVMQEAFKKDRRMLLIIGEPGAGKTTLLKYYALCCLDPERFKRFGFAEPVNVFYLPLRELVKKDDGGYHHLADSLARWASANQLEIDRKLFDGWLRQGQSLVLLDGLDEIGSVDERRKACRWIEGAWKGYHKARFVVTSRRTGYRKDDGIELEVDHDRADVEDFTREQQEKFLANWFRAAFLRDYNDARLPDSEWRSRQERRAEERTTKIVAHLREENNRSLRQLAAIPMILQIMAILWKERDHLPKSRVDLYNSVLDYLLQFRDARRDIEPLMPARDARMVLGPVSLWMQERKSDDAEKGAMQDTMTERLTNLDKPPSAQEFCDYLVDRAGLLMEYGKQSYVFRHKSFREFLAGIELVKKVHRYAGYLDAIIEGFGDDWWDEPLRFFIAHGDEKLFDLFMNKLFASNISDDVLQQKQGFLRTLIEEAPMKKPDALCTHLMNPENSAIRQHVILDCLRVLNNYNVVSVLHTFIQKGFAHDKDIQDKAERVLVSLNKEMSVAPGKAQD